MLSKFLCDLNKCFDFIYIDGSHIAKDVLTDACMAWPLLMPKGLMVFDDYMWEIWVEVGGIAVPIAGETNQNNDGGSQMNEGNVSNVTEFARSEGININEIRGVFTVGGFAATCEGLAYLELVSDPFETLVSQIAAAIIIVIIIFIIVIMILSRGTTTAAAAAGAAAGGAATVVGDEDGDGDVDTDDANEALEDYEEGEEDLPRPDDLA